MLPETSQNGRVTSRLMPLIFSRGTAPNILASRPIIVDSSNDLKLSHRKKIANREPDRPASSASATVMC